MLQDGRWARNWDCCQECGTTERPHQGGGLCKNCYARSYYRKHSKGKNRCVDCGAEIDRRATRCRSCATEANWARGAFNGNPEAIKAAHARGAFGEETRRKLSEAVKAAHARGDFGKEWHRRVTVAAKARWARGDSDSEETSRKRSEAMKARWARGDMDGIFQSPTSIELEVAAALDIMGIEHQSQYRPDGYGRTFDEFVLPNTLIEIQGDYWHGPERPKQQKRDAEKAQWAKDNGYEFMAIWEHEIKEIGVWVIVAQAFT